MLLLRSSRPIARVIGQPLRCVRAVSTLPNNPHIYVHTDPVTSTHTLTLTPTEPPVKSLALGTTTALPPTPSSFRGNPTFHGILQSVLAAHAVHDPDVHAQAAAYASQAGSTLGGSGFILPSNHPSQQHDRQRGSSSSSSSSSAADKRRRPSGGPSSIGTRKETAQPSSAGGAGGASAQGGMGGAGRGGWVHVSDRRNPPDYGRIAWPEDIFGSVEVDARGAFVGADGNYQESGTYRMCTNEGFLGLSPYLRERVVERLTELERQEKAKGA